MGSDNQDYFKRAGRSVGPPGPLRHFRQKLSQERAFLQRGEEHVIPGEARPTRPARRGGEEAPGRGTRRRGGPEETEAASASPGGASPGDVTEGDIPPAGSGAFRASEVDQEEWETDRIAWGFGDPWSRRGPPEESHAFGPPASEDSAIGKGPGAQETEPSLPHAARRLVLRFPLAFRAMSWLLRRLEVSARRIFALRREVDRALGSRGT